MSGLRITLSQALPAFQPGEAVEGEVHWDLPDYTGELELTLRWTTEAKTGTEEPEEVGTERIEVQASPGSRPFRFELPAAPWSFEGRMISVKWFLVLEGAGEEARTEIIVSPTGQPVRPMG